MKKANESNCKEFFHLDHLCFIIQKSQRAVGFFQKASKFTMG